MWLGLCINSPSPIPSAAAGSQLWTTIRIRLLGARILPWQEFCHTLSWASKTFLLAGPKGVCDANPMCGRIFAMAELSSGTCADRMQCTGPAQQGGPQDTAFSWQSPARTLRVCPLLCPMLSLMLSPVLRILPWREFCHAHLDLGMSNACTSWP